MKKYSGTLQDIENRCIVICCFGRVWFKGVSQIAFSSALTFFII
jgi:hypothetical protein